MDHVSIRLDTDTLQTIKEHCALNNITVQQYIYEAIERHLAKRKPWEKVLSEIDKLKRGNIEDHLMDDYNEFFSAANKFCDVEFELELEIANLLFEHISKDPKYKDDSEKLALLKEKYDIFVDEGP